MVYHGLMTISKHFDKNMLHLQNLRPKVGSEQMWRVGDAKCVLSRCQLFVTSLSIPWGLSILGLFDQQPLGRRKEKSFALSFSGIWYVRLSMCEYIWNMDEYGFHAGFQDADITDICIFETSSPSEYFQRTCWSKESGSTPELLCGVGSPIVVASVSFYGSFNYIIQFNYNIYIYVYNYIYMYIYIHIINQNQCTYRYTTIFTIYYINHSPYVDATWCTFDPRCHQTKSWLPSREEPSGLH